MEPKTKLILLVLLISPLIFTVYWISNSNISTSVAPVARIMKLLIGTVGSKNETNLNATPLENQTTKYTRTADSDADDREKEFAERRRLVKDTCARNMEHMSYGGVEMVPLGQFRWLKKRDLVVCFSAKVGTSTWARYLLGDGFPDVFAQGTNLHGRAIAYLVPQNKTSKESVLQQLMNSTRIANVRHPFTRLVSAFKSKFEPCRTNKNCNGRYLVEEWETIVDFKAFVAFILKRIPVPKLADGKAYSSFDRHWRPFYLNCGMCDIDFHYIVKMETWDEDISYIMSKHGFESDTPVHANSNNSSSIALDYFKTLPLPTILQLYEYYRPDFQLFGYSIEEFIYGYQGFAGQRSF